MTVLCFYASLFYYFYLQYYGNNDLINRQFQYTIFLGLIALLKPSTANLFKGKKK